MTLTVELPDDLAQHENFGREALEALAIAGFRSDALTKHEAAQMLGMGRIAFNDLLISRGVTEHLYGLKEFSEDVRSGDEMRAAGLLPG